MEDEEAAKRMRLDYSSAQPSGRGGGGEEGGSGDAAGGGMSGDAARGRGDEHNHPIEAFTESRLNDGSGGAGAGGKGVGNDVVEEADAGAYAQREEWLTKQEDSGEIRFEPVSNDNVMEHMMWLIDLKNIYSKQLPNMPKEYIVRLVMDRGHRSMVLLKGTTNPTVIGGITYRPYYRQKFGEIAFCAIMATEQVKGYGTRLMNHLKDYATNDEKITHFLTYADNNAVGYFAKQGFTKELMLEREKWVGYIKDYDGGTLMECAINNTINYTNFSDMIRQQREALEHKMKELSNAHIVYPGLDFWKANPGKQMAIGDIPGVREAGWTEEQSRPKYRLATDAGPGPSTRESILQFMAWMVEQTWEHPDAWPFQFPVDPKEVVDYYDIIKDPVDLTTMRERVRKGEYYVTLEVFAADFKRMFNNCRTYNAPETIYYKCANKLESFFEATMQSRLTYIG